MTGRTSQLNALVGSSQLRTAQHGKKESVLNLVGIVSECFTPVSFYF